MNVIVNRTCFTTTVQLKITAVANAESEKVLREDLFGRLAWNWGCDLEIYHEVL